MVEEIKEKPETIEKNDVIAFKTGGTIVTHRVVGNHQVEGYMTTKGDANKQEDLGEVLYANIIGKVVRHVPYLGQLMWILSSNVGKVLMMTLALWILRPVPPACTWQMSTLPSSVVMPK